MPETESPAASNGVPFVDIELEELESTDWLDGIVFLTLLNINGPGQFRLWQDDGFGGAVDSFNTETNLLTFVLSARTHTHFNWGFTELASMSWNSRFPARTWLTGHQNGAAAFTYAVPEASTALLALGGLLLSFRRRR